MKRGLAYTIAYVKNLLGLVSQESVPPLGVVPISSVPPPKPFSLAYDEDISSGIGHFNFNKWRKLKETGGEINKEFYDGEGELIDE
jgi:hypothetical protein